MFRSILGAALAAIVLTTGCDCGGGGDPLPDAGQFTPDTLCLAIAERQCDFYVRCAADPVAAVSGVDITAGRGNQVPESERARCEAALSTDRDCRKLAESLRLARVVEDEAALLACLDAAWPTTHCLRDVVTATTACQSELLVTAAVAASGACALDLECQDGYCNAANADACGTCQPRGGDGAACTRDAMCDEATHFCPGTDGAAGTCIRYTALDGDCTLTDTEQEECGPGNVCALRGAIFPVPRCSVARNEGEQCDMNRFQCLRRAHQVPGLVCAPTPVQGGGTLNKCVKVQAQPGGACGNGEGATFGVETPFCPETEYCLNNACAPRLGAGIVCDAAASQCQSGLRCADDGTGATRCTPYLDVNAACAADDECRALLYCDATTGCQPRLALTTEPCHPSRTCADGFCTAAAGSGTCEALKADDAACGAGAECQSGVCSTTCQDACWD